MEIKDGHDSNDERPSSPLLVLQQISEEAVKMANEAIQNLGSANTSPVWAGHTRCHSEVVSQGHRRSNSLQSFKSSIQRAWRWGGNSQDESRRFDFNPEVLANQKRQWYQLHSPDRSRYKQPTLLFEHFIVTGLHADANLDSIEEAFAKRKKWEQEMIRSGAIDIKSLQHRRPQPPTLEPQMLFKYPPGKRLPMRLKDFCAFSFPGGVKARIVERTPSLSDLNALVYGQEHLGRDDTAFIFSLKAADNGTLYGVCLHVIEIVQRPPAILSSSSPLCHPSPECNRFLVSAPRCYCILTRVPFFELHFEMLNSIIAQERLNRITEFIREMNLNDYSPLASRTQEPFNGFGDSPKMEFDPDLMSSAMPVDSAITLTAAAAGIIPNDDVPSSSSRNGEPHSLTSGSTSEASNASVAREMDKDGKKNVQHFDDRVSDVPEVHMDSCERPYENYENGTMSPETSSLCNRDGHKLERSSSSQSLYSSVRSMRSHDEDDEYFSNQESDYSGDMMTMEWAMENKNDLVQIICAYNALPIPTRGNEIVFKPLEHLQAIQYKRPPISDLGVDENSAEKRLQDPIQSAEVNARLAATEEAIALSVWTTATICRVLSLDSVLALITGVLLEKQIVVVCPNLGVLSATVLSFIPMIRPFEWQSLFLPVLPGKMLDFLDAPVPYIVGIQCKPAELKIKTSNLVQVEVLKDQVKMCYLPLLPRRKELAAELRPIHSILSSQKSIAQRHTVYRCNELQADAAMKFLNVMKTYLESLCADLRSYTITSVQSNNDRVSLLLKDSFIDSFPSRDRPFIKLFVDTQMFTVLSDYHLENCEHVKS